MHPVWSKNSSWSLCPESEIIALRTLMINQDLVHGDEERAEVQQRRESLYAEIKHHRAKGHDGKPCPAARQVWPVAPDWLGNQISAEVRRRNGSIFHH